MRWLAALVLVGIAAVPGQALAADCADPGVPGQFDAFVRDGLTTANMTVHGRVAAGGTSSTCSGATSSPRR
jgi:hypothetical protein